MYKLGLEKAEELEIKLPTSTESWKKQESSRKTIYFCCIDYVPKLRLCGSQQTVENSERDGNTRPFTCILRNLYVAQEATVRTEHETIDRFKIGKGVQQGYILSPCLFNFYGNAGLDE